MQKIKIVAIIGIFLLGVFSFGYIYKRIWNRWGRNYSIMVEVADTGSLPLGTSVFMNGVKVGSVENVYLGADSVTINLSIDRSVQIPIGSQIQINSVGMIGSLKVSIYRPKVVEGYLKDGDVIIGSSPVSTAVILEKVSNLAEQMNVILKDLNLDELSKNVNQIIKNYNEQGNANLIKTIGNIEQVTNEMKAITQSNTVVNSVKNVENITYSLSRILKIGFMADIEWEISKSDSNYNGEIGFSFGSLFLSKRGFTNWNTGYSVVFKKEIGIVDIAAGILYNSFGAIIDLNLFKIAQLSFKMFNFPDVDYRIMANLILKDSIIFGPIYRFKENVVLFHIGYRVEM